MELVFDVLGWSGAALIVSAYFLISRKKVTGESAAYQWMNVFGALGAASNALYHHALPVASINVVWFFIGLHALWLMRKKTD